MVDFCRGDGFSWWLWNLGTVSSFYSSRFGTVAVAIEWVGQGSLMVNIGYLASSVLMMQTLLSLVVEEKKKFSGERRKSRRNIEIK